MKNWWVPGLQIGYEHTFVHQVADFLRGRRRRASRCPPTFRDALETDYVTDAVLKSASTKRWETVQHEGGPDVQDRVQPCQGPWWPLRLVSGRAQSRRRATPAAERAVRRQPPAGSRRRPR